MSSVFNKTYSEYYDLLYEDKPYEKEAEYICRLIQAHSFSAKRILELGCGTGAHAAYFAERGYSIHGIDLSSEMLKKANSRRSRMSESCNKLSFEQGDIKTYRHSGQEKFDVVISLFHVFSYQRTNEDLKRAFETAAVHLRPGGILIFDYWYGPAVLNELPSVRVKRLENQTITVLRIAEPELHCSENFVRVKYTVQLTEKKTGRFEQILEDHDMRYLFIPEINLLTGGKFGARIHHAWMTEHEPKITDWSVVSVLEYLS